MVTPLYDAVDSMEAAHRPLTDNDGRAEGSWLMDADEAELIDAEIDRIDKRLLFVGRRLHRLHTAIADDVLAAESDGALVGA
jgi:hypothetical protein